MLRRTFFKRVLVAAGCLAGIKPVLESAGKGLKFLAPLDRQTYKKLMHSYNYGDKLSAALYKYNKLDVRMTYEMYRTNFGRVYDLL